MKNRTKILFIILVVLCAALFALDMAVGSVALSVDEIWQTLLGRGGDSAAIVLHFRLPKTLMAMLSGAALAAVGLSMQTIFRNPLAGPYVLGVSSGASLGVSLFLLGLPLVGLSASNEIVRNIGVVGAAWIGSALIMIVVIATTARIKNIMTVLILVMMFGSAATALVEILQYLSPESALKSFVVWTMGSLGGVTIGQLLIVVPVIAVGLLLSIRLIKPLDMLLLGESYARSMGLNVKRTRVTVAIITVLLAGTITAYCGPIGFVGLAVPHVARMLFRRADHRVLMPASMLTGAVMMLFCDIASQLPSGDLVLPINTVTALFGIPIVIAVIVRNRKTVV